MSDIREEIYSVEDNINELMKVRREKLAKLCAEGKNPFVFEGFDVSNYSAEILDCFDEFESKEVTIAGRMMSRRIMGKASFVHILDTRGQIQVYVQINELGVQAYDEFKSYDIGDIIGVKGDVFKTQKGEISVKGKEIVLLAKSLRPLPEKWHGLKDVDLRYRHRHLDLIMNPDVKRKFEIRSNVIKLIRRYLDDAGYLEVETPVLQGIAGGAAARPFITHHNTLGIDMYLRIATELHLKRLIIGGFDKVYELGRIFRNEGISVKHNPEFTSVELYKAYADYKDMMHLTENMIATVASEILGTTRVKYQGEEIDFAAPWIRMTMVEAVHKYASVDFTTLQTAVQVKKAAQDAGVVLKEGTTWGHALNEVFQQKAEPYLRQPTFIMDYPVEVSPLAKRMVSDPRLTCRFELFILGREIANAFSELNDPIDQRERFVAQAKQRTAGDEEAHMMDEDFVHALEVGMPPTGGLGIGIDRLVMLFTDAHSIRDVILFPTMKSHTRNQERRHD